MAHGIKCRPLSLFSYTVSDCSVQSRVTSLKLVNANMINDSLRYQYTSNGIFHGSYFTVERLAQTSIKYIIFSESLGIANYEGILG